MQSLTKYSLVFTTGCVLLAAAASTANAQARPVPNPALSQYQSPDGSYPSLADYTRSVEGTPCGLTCTYVGQQRRADFYGRSEAR
jgi:hypothetical protein